MKKIYQLTMGCLMLCALVACDGGTSTSTMSDNGDKEASEKYSNYQEACRKGDFDAAYNILEKKKEEFEKFKEENELVIEKKTGLFRDRYEYDYSNQEKYVAMVKNYKEGMNYVFNAEMLFLVSQNTEEASNRILYLLAEYHIPGMPPTAGMYYKDEEYDAVNEYMEGIAFFNSRCNSVIDMAIAQKNEKLAQDVIKIMKQNVDYETRDTGIGNSGYGRCLKVSSLGVNNSDKDLAKKKLEEAIKSGAFK